MEIVKAYRTSKGQLFESPIEYLKAKFEIEIQALFNNSSKYLMNNSFTPKEIAQILLAKQEEIIKTMKTHNRKMNWYLAREKQTV